MTDRSALEALLEVQAHDTRLDQLDHQLAALPERAALAAEHINGIYAAAGIDHRVRVFETMPALCAAASTVERQGVLSYRSNRKRTDRASSALITRRRVPGFLSRS